MSGETKEFCEMGNFIKRAKRALLALLLASTQLVSLVSVGIQNASAADTGFLTPTSTHGDNSSNSAWDVNTPSLVQASDNQYATDDDEDQQDWSNFNIPTIPNGSIIDGIEVNIEAKSSDSSGCRLEVNLSWNNGSSSTTDKNANINGSDTT